MLLMARSPVFFTMFFGNISEGTQEVFVDDVDPEAFKETLRYLCVWLPSQ
jgi:hypothetical protein